MGMIFRLSFIICLYFCHFSAPNGQLHVYGYETKQFVELWESNQTIQYPTNEYEIQALIRHAHQHGSTTVRVIGSGHSYEKAIYDGQDIDGKEKLTIISLEEYHGVTIDKKNNVAIVKAGTVIGPNPEIDNKNIEESLVGILNQHGYAMPNLGGITRQTIAGFLSTGAAGGSLSYSFYDVLVGIRLIDGKGTIYDISKKDSKFYAAGISMGLFGIITSVNISLTTKSYYIKGSETVSPSTSPSSNASKGCPIDMFGDGSRQYPSLAKFLKNGPDYSRIVWYPVKGCDRSVIWEASRYDRKPLPPIVPYPQTADANLTAEALQVADILIAINALAADTEEYYSFLCSILDQVEPFGKREFFDIYNNSLPMDNYADYKVL
jgi:D-arabinono-1,4-lactone oxidase